MKGYNPPETLQLLVKNQWLVESITSLGSGYLSYLTYLSSDIEPEVLIAIQQQQLAGGSLGEVIKIGPAQNRRIAEVELNEIHNFDSFIRFDFRILEVIPFLRDGIVSHQTDYLCYFKKNSV